YEHVMIDLTSTYVFFAHSLHDALPIFGILEHEGDGRSGGRRVVDEELPELLGAQVVEALHVGGGPRHVAHDVVRALGDLADHLEDRKSTRLNSSHVKISYAVFCLKKKK